MNRGPKITDWYVSEVNNGYILRPANCMDRGEAMSNAGTFVFVSVQDMADFFEDAQVLQ